MGSVNNKSNSRMDSLETNIYNMDKGAGEAKKMEEMAEEPEALRVKQIDKTEDQIGIEERDEIRKSGRRRLK